VRVLKREIPYTYGEWTKFVFFGDLHLGSKLFSRSNFERNVIDAYKNDKSTYFIDMGDGMDCIIAQGGDRRYKASLMDPKYVGIDDPIDAQIRDYAEMLQPIKDRLLCIVDSNHHGTILERCGTDPTKRLAYLLWPDKAEERYLGESGFLYLNFICHSSTGKQLTHGSTGRGFRGKTISLCHGFGNSGGKTDGGTMTTLGRDANFYEADWHAYGHNHRLQSWDRIKIGINHTKERIVSKKEIVLNTGTYMKAFTDDAVSTYPERRRMAPNELGHIELDIRFATARNPSLGKKNKHGSKTEWYEEIRHYKRSVL